MKQLHLGWVTLKELAEWFGIAESTMKKKSCKEKRLQLLKSFADYHMEGKKVYIDKIHIDTYSKAYDVIKEKFPSTWSKSGLDTAARVGSEIYYRNKSVSGQIQETTSQAYASKVKRELYGRNYLANDRGSLGTSEYCWCKKTSKGYEFLTQEQYDIIKDAATEAYGSYNSEIAKLADALHNNEISTQEYAQGVGELTLQNKEDCFGRFMSIVTEKLGFYPDKATLIHKDEESAW